MCVCVCACMHVCVCVDGMNLKYALCWHIHVSVYSILCHCYWAIQAGLLTPLTFARHCLSPLAAFTFSVYFTMEGGDREFANFTLPTLKALLVACSHNVSGNKQ